MPPLCPRHDRVPPQRATSFTSPDVVTELRKKYAVPSQSTKQIRAAIRNSVPPRRVNSITGMRVGTMPEDAGYKGDWQNGTAYAGLDPGNKKPSAPDASRLSAVSSETTPLQQQARDFQDGVKLANDSTFKTAEPTSRHRTTRVINRSVITAPGPIGVTAANLFNKRPPSKGGDISDIRFQAQE